MKQIRSCFELRKFYACEKIGHIAKFCTENKQSCNVALFENTDPNFGPAQRTMVSVEIGGKNVNVLYDTGSQFSIITKQVYDSLPCKPRLLQSKHMILYRVNLDCYKANI